MNIDYDGTNFKMVTSYDELSTVKLLPNRRFNSKTKVWSAPPYRRNIETIRKVFMNMPGTKVTDRAREKINLVNQIVNKVNLKFPIGYSFKTKPMPHQEQALDFLYDRENGALLMEMGTGKTKVAIDLLSCLFSEGKIDRVLVVCPCSIRENWVKEIGTHGPLSYDCMIANSKAPFRKFVSLYGSQLSFSVPIAVMGTESVSQGYKKGATFEAVENFVSSGRPLIIVDESHLIKTHSATRSRNIVRLGTYAKRKIIMTGTPVAQSPLDLFMQYQFLDPDIIGIGSWYAFRNRYAVLEEVRSRAGIFQTVVGYQNIEELTQCVSDYTFQCFKREVLDLPEKVHQERIIEMTTNQRKMYNKMVKERIVALTTEPGENKQQISATNVLSSLIYLQQIASGFITTKDEKTGDKKVSDVMSPDKNPKIKEMLSVISELPEDKKIIIWCKFRKENEIITEILRQNYGESSAVEFHGGIPHAERENRIREFKTSPEARFFVASLQAGSVGLTLNESDVVIYFSNSFKYIDRVQSEDRNHRIGQKNTVLYIDLTVKNSVEEKIKLAIETKSTLGELVKIAISKAGIVRAFEETANK